MAINVFRSAKNAGRMLGRGVNSKFVSNVSRDLIKAGEVGNKILDNPAVKALAVSGGPEGMALYGGARAVSGGAIQAGKGIQKAKGVINTLPAFKS